MLWRERILGHKLQGVLGIYNRHSYDVEKRQALLSWENRLREILGLSEPISNVIQLGRTVDNEIDFRKKHLMEIENYFDCYPFTHETAGRIKDGLKQKYDAESVKRFIYEIRDCCEGAACLIDQPNCKKFNNKRKSMLAILEKSNQLLDSLRQDNGIYRNSNFSDLLEQKHAELGLECQELAVTTCSLLGILIQKLKSFDELNEQRIKGRPTADSMGIVAKIAAIWESCFLEKPTQYIDGLFAEVVQIVLEGLNLPYEYPQRKIKDALRKPSTKTE